MKTKILILVLCLFSVLYVKAQQRTDYFFYSGHSDYTERDYSMVHYKTVEDFAFQDVVVDAAPIGNGFVALSGLALIYFVLKRKEIAK